MENSRLQYLLSRISQGLREDELRELNTLLYEQDFEEAYDRAQHNAAGEPVPVSESIPHKEVRILNNILKNQDRDIPVIVHPASPRWGWMAAAVLIVALSVIGLYVAPNDEQTTAQEQSHPGEYEGKQFIVLPDQTTVLLNAGSRLTYQPAFGTRVREVTLTGEAYFDVAHDPAHPFIVRTGQVKTTVLGTAFNVKAYAEQQDIVVTVARGKVAVGDDTREYDQLRPDEQLAVNKHTRHITKTSTRTREALAWKEQFLILNGLTMEEAAKQIGERFNVTVTIQNPALKTCRMQATFLNGEGLDYVVTTVCRVVEATWQQKDGQVIIQGGLACE